MAMTFGIHIGHMGGPLEEMRKLWQFADAQGFDWFSVSDHFQESPPRGTAQIVRGRDERDVPPSAPSESGAGRLAREGDDALHVRGGVRVARSLVGNYVTSLDMAGVSLTVSVLDSELLRLWDAPVHTAALRTGA